MRIHRVRFTVRQLLVLVTTVGLALGIAIQAVRYRQLEFLYRQLTAQQIRASTASKYTITVEGAAGVQLDMLLVMKPAGGVPVREATRIVIPFTKEFEATTCHAWFDLLPETGKQGDAFHMTLKRGGEDVSRVEYTITAGNKMSGSLGDL